MFDSCSSNNANIGRDLIQLQMTTFEKDTQILKDFIATSVTELERGEPVHVSGGYIQRDYDRNLLDSNCSTIVKKLLELGYIYTSNHGFGCLDYRFTKKIAL